MDTQAFTTQPYQVMAAYDDLRKELATLKEKVRRYLELKFFFDAKTDSPEQYTELCNLDHDLRELCK
jgi:hypothetical protein